MSTDGPNGRADAAYRKFVCRFFLRTLIVSVVLFAITTPARDNPIRTAQYLTPVGAIVVAAIWVIAFASCVGSAIVAIACFLYPLVNRRQ